MLAHPDAIRALGLKWFHSNVYANPELARRFALHGVPAWFFFRRAASGSAGRRAGTGSRSSRRPPPRRARRRGRWAKTPARARMARAARPIEKI
ncbi:thioredoxin family protein [Burkholderia pseudomallei MSHR346]|nr:thioredoxin family protein [Burkholderia pseudomallei MSHR346]